MNSEKKNEQRQNKFNIIYASLLFILISFATQYVVGVLINIPKLIAVFFRFILIPLTMSLILVILYKKNLIKLINQKQINFIQSKYFLFICTLFYILIVTFLKFLKLNSHQYEFFDSGFYLSRIQKLSDSPTLDAIKIATTDGHFQPVLLLFSFINAIFDSPHILYIIQTLMITSAVIPAFLLARKYFGNRIHTYTIPILLLLNPLTQFNDILGFVPDHVVLPLIIWAFYFDSNKKIFATFLVMLGIAICGEQWIPLIIGFSCYQILTHRTSLTGYLNLFFFSFMFIVLLFIWLPHFGSYSSGQNLLSQNSPYFWIKDASFSELIKNLFELRKIFFLFFVFGIFCFLPLLAWPIILVSVPDLAKILLSQELLHYSVEGHYTVGILGVSLVGLMHSLNKVRIIYTECFSKKLLAIVFWVCTSFSIAHSPSPISINFYTLKSAGAFNLSKYFDSNNNEFFEKLAEIKNNLSIMTVEITNDSFSPTLLRSSKSINIFPTDNWHNADLIVIRKNSIMTAGSNSEEKIYNIRYINAKKELESQFHKVLENENYISYINPKINTLD